VSVLHRAPVLSYAVLAAAVVAVTETFPGTPFYSDDGAGSLGGVIFWTALVVIGIAARWRPVWYLAICFDLLGALVSGVLAFWDDGLGFQPKAFVLALLYVALVRILLSREIDDRMWHRSSVQA
jgi:hypothetical protein